MTIKDLITELNRYPDDTEVYMTADNLGLSGDFRYSRVDGNLIILTPGDYEEIS